MKKLLLLSIPFFLICACNQPTKTEKSGMTSNNSNIPKDSRPQSQRKFLKLLSDIYDKCLEQNNEITLKDVADSGKVVLTKFITDSLKDEFKDWKAKIHNIERDKFNGGMTVTFMMSKRAQFDQEDPELNAIFLKELFFDKGTKEMIKPFKKGDEVLLEGMFMSEKDENGNIEFSSYMTAFKEGDAFYNAMFDIVLVNIQPVK